MYCVFATVQGRSLVAASKGATLPGGVKAAPCSGFSCLGAQAIVMRASVVEALEHVAQ